MQLKYDKNTISVTSFKTYFITNEQICDMQELYITICSILFMYSCLYSYIFIIIKNIIK